MNKKKLVILGLSGILLGGLILDSTVSEARGVRVRSSFRSPKTRIRTTKPKVKLNKGSNIKSKGINKNKSKTYKQKTSNKSNTPKTEKSNKNTVKDNTKTSAGTSNGFTSSKTFTGNKTDFMKGTSYATSTNTNRSFMDSMYRTMFYYNIFNNSHKNNVIDDLKKENTDLKEGNLDMLQPIILPKTIVDGKPTEEDKKLLKEMGLTEEKVKDLGKKGNWVKVETKDGKEIMMLVSKEQKDVLDGSKISK